MNIESITTVNACAAIDKTDHLLSLAKEGRRYGANEELYPWQSMVEFDSDYNNGIREELIREFGGNPFTRQSWDQHGGFYYLDEGEKSRFGSFTEYVDYCDTQCRNVFSEIIDSLVKYKYYLRSLAE